MLHAFDDGNYNTVIISWSAINSLLPDGYKVEINNVKYNQIIKENKIIICSKCNEKIPYQDIKLQQVMLNSITYMVTQKKYEVIWTCTKCKYENIFDEKQIRIVKFKEPYYLEVVHEPPKRNYGISDRTVFDIQFRKWFTFALDEIESKIGKYRADYIAQLESDGVQIIDEDHET